MEDAACSRSEVAPSVDVGHHVVAKAFFVFCGAVEIDAVDGAAEFLKLGLGNPQPRFSLGLSEREPDFAPRSNAMSFAEQLGHLARGVAGDQGGSE